MVIKITIRTLDSQNYQFEVEDDWTVLKFKEHIQSTVNVSPQEQRLIFCGRALQDHNKLIEYDCNGKVIHLVRRPPPPVNGPNQDSSSTATAADPNNNNSSSNYAPGSNENPRFLDESNILFSAMTLGSETNMTNILRHILSLQQAIFFRATNGQAPTETATEPTSMTDLDRHLHNALRLLRITTTMMNECFVRISALPLNGPNHGPTPGANLDNPSPLLVSSLNYLSREAGLSAIETAQSFAPPAGATTDDMDIRSPGNTASDRTSLPRQSLTTDDLPSSTRRIPSVATAGSSIDGPLSTPSLRQRGELDLDRYLNILQFSTALQGQFQTLVSRYHHSTQMYRRGDFSAAQSSDSSNAPPSAPLNVAPAPNQVPSQVPNQENQTNQSSQLASTLLYEAQILSYYIPRIVHHLGHLQHALSDFSIDFTTGTLSLASSSTRNRPPPFARRANTAQQESSLPTPQQQPESTPSEHRSSAPPVREQPSPTHVLEGSLTITATTFDPMDAQSTQPTIITANSPGSTTVMFSPESSAGQAIHIPLSIPISMTSNGSVNIDFAPNPERRTGAPPSQASGLGPQQQHQQPQQPESNQPRAPSNQQNTATNGTQTGMRPIGVISGRIPLPFDYYLPCFSPYANYSVVHRPVNRGMEVPAARIVVRTSRPQGAEPISREQVVNLSAPTGQNQSNMPPQGNQAPADLGLSDVINNIVGSLFRGPTNQNSQQRADEPNTAQANRDQPFLNIIPELALNAASQILGGMMGGLQQPSPATAPQTSAHGNPSAPASTVMMDIDIDDGSSNSQSEYRFQDARENQSPSTSSSSLQSTNRASTHRLPPASSGTSRIPSSVSSQIGYERQQLVEVMQNHPDWIPVIEADVMELSQQANSDRQPFFSDAYLSSIPRKRRRLLTASPDRVPILQPSSSQAITNLLRRAISSSTSASAESFDPALSSISSDSELQTAYEEYIKTAVEARLLSDDDYNPQKFENSRKYFK